MSKLPLLSQFLRFDVHEILQREKTSFWGCIWNQADDTQGTGPRIHWMEAPWLPGELCREQIERGTPHAQWKGPDHAQTPCLSGR